MKLPASVRRPLERFSRNVVVQRRLPADLGGTMLDVSPGAALTYWTGIRGPNFDDLHDFARRHIQRGDVVWDVGANMGVLTFTAAHQVGASGRVLAFEPDWWSGQLLQRSRQRNPQFAARLQILGVAVSDACTLQRLIIPRHCRAATHLETAGGAGVAITGGPRDQLLVPTVSLDWVAGFEPAPSIIKIDVDGGEHRVLLGAQTLLQTTRPKILIEVYERNADAVGLLFHRLGYRLYSYEKGDRDCRPIDRPTYNTLALPA